MNNNIIQTKTDMETKELGKEFAKKMVGGEIICLYGDLGSGKTTFVQGLAEGLGIKKKVTSPTFVLVHQFPLVNNKVFYHFDCYRLQKNNVKDIGLYELFSEKNIIAIEWAERIKDFLPKKRIDIKIDYNSKNKRDISILYLK